jgi:hypothetical protein
MEEVRQALNLFLSLLKQIIKMIMAVNKIIIILININNLLCLIKYLKVLILKILFKIKIIITIHNSKNMKDFFNKLKKKYEFFADFSFFFTFFFSLKNLFL